MTRTFDPFDELATIFLSPAAPASAPNRRPPLSAAASRSSMEILLAGNLPVRAALWLTPYADALGRELGATAMIRLDGDEPSVQIVRGPAALADRPLGADLHRCVSNLGASIDVWLVRPAAAASPMDLVEAGADRITILSSGDEAAVIGAYQIVKGLVQASEAAAKPLPAIALAVVGAEQREAASVVERLNRTTVSFLGVEVKAGICLHRIDAGLKPTRFVSFAGQACPAAGEVTRWIQAARTAGSSNSAQSSIVGQVHADRDEDAIDVERIARIRPATPPRSTPIESPAIKPASPRAGSTSPAAAPVPVESIQQAVAGSPNPAVAKVCAKLAPKPARTIEPKRPESPVEPSTGRGLPVELCSHVPGLSPLNVRAPGHERIEIATDAQGRLHLLAREQAIRELRIVENWAWRHREILALACPGRKIDAAQRAACHVFTAEPANVSDLHGTDLRLHVLAPVVLDGQTAWYAAPLNDVS